MRDLDQKLFLRLQTFVYMSKQQQSSHCTQHWNHVGQTSIALLLETCLPLDQAQYTGK